MSEHETPASKIIAALVGVQGELTNPVRDKKGIYGKYSSLEGMLDTLRPALAKHNLVLWQYLRGELVITELAHADGGRLEFQYPLIVNPQNSNKTFAVAAAFTYSRRYALYGIFNVQGDDIDEEDANLEEKSKKALEKEKPKKNSPDPVLDELIANAEKAQPAEPNLAAVAEKMAKTHKNLRANDLAWMDDPSFEDFIYETAKEKNLSQEDVRLHALKNPEHARQVFIRWKGVPDD